MSAGVDDGRNGGLSRRALLARASVLGAAGALGSLAEPAGAVASPEATASGEGAVAPFAGGHQAGIATPRPAGVALAAFDVHARSTAGLAALLRTWTGAIAKLSAGELAGAADSGETLGLPPSALTVTVGFGPSLFDGRFGIAGRRPAALAELPAFPDEQLDPAQSNGDLVVQACAQEATVATHAIRQLLNEAGGSVRLRWLTTGFAPPAVQLHGATPRNVLGFRDGSGNPALGSAQFDAAVWVRPGARPSWLAGGTYLCYRKIRVDLGTWDRLGASDQEAVIGRAKRSGAPLSGGRERSALNLAKRNADGTLAIPPGSHVRLASPQLNGGATMFRRSFEYAEGARGRTGGLDGGQLFLAFVADPDAQFIPVLNKLSQGDHLAQFTLHVASGLWAVPPAPRPGGWLGQTLLS